MSTIFGNLAKNIPPFDDVVRLVADFAYIKEELIAFQQSKLFNEGVDSDKKFLRTDTAREQGNVAYSNYTMQDKESRGLPSVRVTLLQQEYFYNSMKAIVSNTFYNLEANFKKPDGHIYDNFTDSYSSESNFENAILGLKDEDLQIWIDKVFKPQLVKSYQFAITQAINASR